MISRYRVIGEAGASAAYRAEDTVLGRQVLIRFLPPDTSAARVRAAAALSHPAICAILDSGEHEGRAFIVTEELEGVLLRRRITGHPQPLERLLEWGDQIADALDYAHQKGVVHGALCPENIFITARGHAVVLNFGLIDPAAQAHAFATAATADTMNGDPREDGSWAAGFSPEQARGEPVDERTDLFGFGVLLYQMATGQLPFAGRTPALLFDSVLNRDPRPPAELNPLLPDELGHILRRCLEKNRHLRYQTAADLRADLRRLQRGSGTTRVVTPFLPPRRRRRRLPLIPVAGTIAAALAVAGLVWWLLRPREAPSRFGIRQLTANPSDLPVTGTALAPDAIWLAWSDARGIHYLVLATGETQDVPNTAGYMVIAASPDSTWVRAKRSEPGGTFTYWRISVPGGVPERVGVARAPDGAPGESEPSPDGKLVAWYDDHALRIFDAAGGNVRQLAELGPNILLNGRPQWSPDGKRLAFARYFIPAAGQAGLSTLDLADAATGATTAVYKATAYLRTVSWLSDALMAISLGALRPGFENENVWLMAIDAHAPRLTAPPKQLTNWYAVTIRDIHAAADGNRLVVLRRYHQSDVYVARLLRDGRQLETPRRLTLDDRSDLPSAWTSDSRSVLFFSNRTGLFQVYRQDIDQASAVELTSSTTGTLAPRITGDGRWVLYFQVSGTPGIPARLMRVSSSGGAPQEVARPAAEASVRCARSGPCFLQTHMSADLSIVSELDPLKGPVRELFRVQPRGGDLDVSPDATRFAYVLPAPVRNRIRVLDRSGATLRDFEVKDTVDLRALDWTPDGRGLFVGDYLPGTGVRLLHTDLDGNSTVLWNQPASTQTWAIPSPDGKWLAALSATEDSNVWLLENFR